MPCKSACRGFPHYTRKNLVFTRKSQKKLKIKKAFSLDIPCFQPYDCPMNRTLIYPIKENENALHIEQFLRRQGYSRQNLTDLKKMPESILVNGHWSRLNQRVYTGDTLVVRIQETTSSDKIPPVCLPLTILYEDEDIVVVNKPAGMPVHPSLNNYTNSLANALAWYYQEQHKPFIFRCTNRLDRDTSGITVIAKHMLSSNLLSSMTRRHTIIREYLAVVKGKVEPSQGSICAPIARKGTSLVERTVDFEHGEHAVTHYKTLSATQLREDNTHSLVWLKLETGRTHQIRVHMKYLGFPLIGDYLYNPDMEYIKRQALHSWRLSFPHPITGKNMCFTAPLPKDMAALFPDF